MKPIDRVAEELIEASNVESFSENCVTWQGWPNLNHEKSLKSESRTMD